MSNVTTTTCKRCGQSDLAWVQSKKTGRWYLALTQKYHGMPATGTSAAVPGGITVLAHRPHKCDDPSSGRPVCDTCGHRHDVHSTSTCLLHQRNNVLADPQWEARTPARWPNLNRHSLDAGDFRAEIEHDTVTGEVLVNVWYNNQAFTTSGVTYRDTPFATVDEAKAKVLEVISI